MADRLNPGERLSVGASLTSTSGRCVLSLKGDGNLVFSFDGHPIWSSNTAGSGATEAIMQADGNFVIYGPSGPIWATNTREPGSRLVVENDLHVLVWTADNRIVWQAISEGRG